MKVNVTHVEASPWTPPNNPQADPLYTVHIAGQGSPQKTYDKTLANVGWHEAEQYTSKSGKTYWRIPKNSPQTAAQPQERVFKADPDKQESIEWQACLKAAIEAVRDYYTLRADKPVGPLSAYKQEIVEAVVTFTQTLDKKPNHLSVRPQETMQDQGDYAQAQFDEVPLELYDKTVVEAGSDEVDLNDIPF